MQSKKLKYIKYLKVFSNCPPKDFREINRKCYRWTKLPVTKDDFVPLSLLREPPKRLLDDEDKLCMSYGLSMFNTLESALKRYKSLYDKQRNHQRILFKKRHDYISSLSLTPESGLADLPDLKNGHFTFHEYNETELTKNVLFSQNIFDSNGNIEL